MIRVKLKWENNILHFYCVGHAEYDKNGKDLVCAAASMLCCTLIYRLERLLGDRVQVERESGNVHLRAEVPWAGYGEIEDSVETIMDGYNLLAEKYPGNVGIVDS